MVSNSAIRPVCITQTKNWSLMRAANWKITELFGINDQRNCLVKIWNSYHNYNPGNKLCLVNSECKFRLKYFSGNLEH